MTNDLVRAVRRFTDAQAGDSPFATAIPGLFILRADHAKHPSHMIHKPALCVVVQGRKQTTFGAKRFEYGAGQALVVSVEMPAFGNAIEASPSEPYLGVVIELDLGVMRDLVEDLDAPPAPAGKIGHGVFLTDFAGPLSDCVLRAVRLLDTPKAIAQLYPAIMREICYWLATGPQRGDVAGMTLGNSHTQRVILAIHALRNRFAEPVRIEELASVAKLSPSAFHRQFKAVTSMTPLQYQKRLRLLEARRLMLSDAANVEAAAYQVGYESPSQFSREYARMFGVPPRKDLRALQHAAV